MHHGPKSWCIVSNSDRFAKSVTVVDTISTTVIFYFLLLYRRFLRKSRDFPNIFGCEQVVQPNYPQPRVPKSTAWENCNRYKNINDKLLFFILYKKPPMAGSDPNCGRLFACTPGQKGQKGQNRGSYK